MNFTKSLLYSLAVSICLLTIGCNSSKNENVKQEKTDVKTENKLVADVKPNTPETTHVTKESKSDDQGQQNLPLDAFVSSSKMNILYRGIDNPINVSVSGVSSDRIRLIATNGVLRSLKDGYSIKPRKGSKCRISVQVSTMDGYKTVSNKEFRVLSLPSPTASLMGRQGGSIARNQLLVTRGISARYSDDFPFDVIFNVTEFTVSATIRGYQESSSARGAYFTSRQKQLFGKLKKGSLIVIHDIKAKGTDGSIRELGALVFKIK